MLKTKKKKKKNLKGKGIRGVHFFRSSLFWDEVLISELLLLKICLKLLNKSSKETFVVLSPIDLLTVLSIDAAPQY